MWGLLFAKVLHMSWIGCYSVAVALLVRRLLIRCGAERKYSYFLWLAVFLNFCLPVSVQGSFTLIPQRVAEFSPGNDAVMEQEAQSEEPLEVHVLSTGEAGVQEEAVFSEEKEEPSNAEGEPGVSKKIKTAFKDVQIQAKILHTAGRIWILGVLALLIYNAAVAVRFSRQLSEKKIVVWNEKERIAQIEGLSAPFLWGVLRPVIYLPVGMEPEEKRYIVAHESFHRRRKDHLTKPLIFAATVFHWFNPLAWLAYSLCCKDMEISCDEAVLSKARTNIRKAYAESLLKYAAKQNGYVMTPLTFGEPSVKSRIQNVLRYKKRNVFFSVLAMILVAAAAAGLLTRPASQALPEPEASEEESVPVPEETPVSEGQPDSPALEVINNGGELIRVDGELYYAAGQRLYSGKGTVYTSLVGKDGSVVYVYDPEGDSFKRLADGRIVGWAEDWNTPYIWKTEYDNAVGSPETPGLYILGELDLAAVYTGEADFLGIDGQYAYLSRTEEEGIYIDRVWAGDNTYTENVLGHALPVQMITEFYAENDYLLFTAGEVQGSGGYFYGDFYSYNYTPGALREEHLTDTGVFEAAGGYIYYQRYDTQSEDGSYGLYRASYDLTGEELIGENLTIRAVDKDSGTILAEKQSDESGVSDLIRINPDGSGEQLLLDMSKLLEAPWEGDEEPVGGAYFDWELEEGDKIRFSQVNILGDMISVRAEQWGYREGADTGWRSSLIQSGYLQMNADGSGLRVWDPELLMQQEGDNAGFLASVSGTPCDPAEEGWNLEAVLDVRDTFSFMSYVPNPGTENDTYLLGQTQSYTLYGKGDYESMLIVKDGHYASIEYPYGSNYMILPDLMEADFDGDGMKELAIILNVKHGTGVYIDTLFMADAKTDGELYVYQFTEENFDLQLSAPLSFGQTDEGLQAYLEGHPMGNAMAGDEETGPYDRVSVGDQIRFSYGGGMIRIHALLEFFREGESGMLFESNEYGIRASVSYRDGGVFALTDFAVRNEVMDERIAVLVSTAYKETDLYTGGQIYIVDIYYDDGQIESGQFEVVAVVQSAASESYDFANLKLKKQSDGVWYMTDVLWEK